MGFFKKLGFKKGKQIAEEWLNSESMSQLEKERVI